jgi:chitodextrinase
MTEFVIQSAPWLPGTPVGAWPAETYPPGVPQPSGAAVASGTVDTSGVLALAGLAEQRRYVAFAQGRAVRFATPLERVGDGYRADRERIRALEAAQPEGGSVGSMPAVDTGQDMRLIAFDDGRVIAIPASAQPPSTPAAPAVAIRLSSVKVSWTASLRAASYAVFRDGVQIATSEQLSYRDTGVAPGSTYSYQVRAYDQYGQPSAMGAATLAFVDPAMNAAPTIAIRTWPATAPTNGATIIRLNTVDVDAQTLATVLSVDSGSLTPTQDPSAWLLNV